jgi:hypothetical protein
MRYLLPFLGILGSVLLAIPAPAATWKVGRAANGCDGPCDYHDINAGAAGFGIQYCMTRPSTIPGDTVRVWPGAYGAKIQMKSDVVLVSRYGASTVTIFGAAGAEPAIFLVDTGSGTVVDGFTVRWDATSGGIGGGVGAYVSSGIIRNCIFDDCLAGVGSGVYLQTCDMTIENNLFTVNESTSGGGALTISGGSPIIRNNSFWGNLCPFGFQGASVYATGTTATLDRNIITASQGGAAVYCGGSNNGAITCNMFWDNPLGSFAGTCPDSVGLGGNVVADPLFCNPASDDFGVCSDSPALLGPCGVVGYTSPGGNCAACQPTPVAQLESRTWGGVKALYRR